MDVTSGIVGHLLFMGQDPVCENVCLSVWKWESKSLRNAPVSDKLESYIQ